MATLFPTIGVKDSVTGHGGGPPPPSFGGGDGSSGNGGPDYLERLRRARLGIAIALVGIVMLFVSFTSAYIVRRGLPTLDEASGQYVRDWLQVNLPVQLLLINTLLLVVSSITMELARRQITRQTALAPVRSIPGVSMGKEREFPWLTLTIILGTGFLVGQWMAWGELANRGFNLSSNTSSAFVYLLTGTHAVHLLGGVVALLYAGVITAMKRPIESRRIVIDVTAWYWHFVTLLWIYLFALLEFAR
jgi:cytochrome c oxidase subunit 3